MFNTKLNYETQFFADGYELSGIESVDLSYQNSANVAKFLGTKKGSSVVSGPVDQKLNISRYLIYNDPILDYTGNLNMSGSIHYESESYGFNSGYLSDYSVNCAVGAVPKVSANFVVLDEMRSGVSASGSASHPDIYIPSQGSISIVCDHVSSNRVVGFDYAIKANRKLFYTIGSQTISDILFLPPLEYSASVQIEVDDAFLQDAFTFLEERENKTISFTIKGRNGETLQTLSIPKASVSAEQFQAAADGVAKLTINYIGHS
jgi:hypothetical protein